jgi:hypothetical protein
LEALEDRLAPATLTVNSTQDTASPTDPYLSLREAIALVNSPQLPGDLSAQILAQINGTLHENGTDTILFDPIQVSGPITLGGTQLELTVPGSTAAVTIDGGAAGVTVDGNNASRVFHLDSGVQATLEHLTLTRGDPGCIYAVSSILTVCDSTLAGNTGFADAVINAASCRVVVCNTFVAGNSETGILASAHSIVTVTDSTLAGNAAVGPGGAIYAVSSSVTVSNSTLSGNSTSFYGGGVYALSSSVTVSNSTLTGNSATGSGGGGALCGINGSSVTVSNSTLAANSAASGGGIYNDLSTLYLRTTVLAGNRSNPGSGPDVRGFVSSDSSYNLVGIGDSTLSGLSNGVNHNLVGTPDSSIDPLLAPLGDYGGPTQTMPLLAGSPALNAGDPGLAGTPDQRGVARTGGVNIGAFQASAASFVVSAPDSATAGVPFDVVVTALDQFGQAAVGYTGTIRFSSTDPDPNVALPPDYTFQVSDGGVATFSAGVTLFTSGDQTLTVTDFDSGISGSTIITL